MAEEFYGGYLDPSTVKAGMSVGFETFMDESNACDNWAYTGVVEKILKRGGYVMVRWDGHGLHKHRTRDLWAFPSQFDTEGSDG